MNITLQFINQMPVAYITEYYADWEHDSISKYILSTNPYKWPTDPKLSGGAADESGVQLKNTYSSNVDNWFTQEGREFCPLLRINRKLFSDEIVNLLIDKHLFFKYLENCNSDATYVNYYENNHSYELHWDRAIISACYTFFKEPKQFTGGTFNIEGKLNFEPENNSIIIFPSFLNHKIEGVSANSLGHCLGRFSVVQFAQII